MPSGQIATKAVRARVFVLLNSVCSAVGCGIWLDIGARTPANARHWKMPRVRPRAFGMGPIVNKSMKGGSAGLIKENDPGTTGLTRGISGDQIVQVIEAQLGECRGIVP